MRQIKYFTHGFMMAISVLAMCLTMSACGGDGDDDIDRNINDNNKQGSTRGEYKIDVSFSGDTSGWDLEIYFYSADNQGYRYPIYEGDKLLEPNSSGTLWKSTEFRNYSIKTDNKGWGVVCQVNMFKKKKATNVSPVTINVKSYYNNKMRFEDSFVAEPQYREVYLHLTTEKITYFTCKE